MWGLLGIALLVSAAEDFIATSTLTPITECSGCSFVVPNEMHPGDALEIWGQTVPGVYISVGSERSFVGAASSQATSLVIIDRDPAVTQFAYINRALLRLSRDLEDYRHLRLKASHHEWKTRLEETINSPQADRFLTDIRYWQWWSNYVRNPGVGSELYRQGWKYVFPTLHADGTSFSTEVFYGVNYLRDENLFKKLRAMSLSGRIAIRSFDLNNADERRRLVRDLVASRERLSVLDLSNAWWGRYIHEPHSLADDFIPLLQPGSILLVTHHAKNEPRLKRRAFSPVEWAYMGFSMSENSIDFIIDYLGSRRFFRKDLIQPVRASQFNRLLSEDEVCRAVLRARGLANASAKATAPAR